MDSETQGRSSQRGDRPQVLQGAGALVFGTAIGIGLLIMAGAGMARANDPSQRVALIAGFGCGYVGPLVLRIAGLVRRGHPERPQWARRLVLLLVLLPLILAAVSFAVLPFAVAGKFATGVLVSFALGFTLLEDQSPASPA